MLLGCFVKNFVGHGIVCLALVPHACCNRRKKYHVFQGILLCGCQQIVQSFDFGVKDPLKLLLTFICYYFVFQNPGTMDDGMDAGIFFTDGCQGSCHGFGIAYIHLVIGYY